MITDLVVEAEQYCQLQCNSHLSSFQNTEEYTKAIEIASNNKYTNHLQSNGIWIDLTYANDTNEWFWSGNLLDFENNIDQNPFQTNILSLDPYSNKHCTILSASFDYKFETNILSINPSTTPSNNPSKYPSTYPSISPTRNPSPSPTLLPTSPGTVICPDIITGMYNGGELQLEVQLPYNGDLIFDASNSEFNIIHLRVFENNNGTTGEQLASVHNKNILKLTNINMNNYIFTIRGNTNGMFNVIIKCSSNNPTVSPSINPTISPTISPTITCNDNCQNIIISDIITVKITFEFIINKSII